METLAVFNTKPDRGLGISNLYDGPINDLAGLLAGSAAFPPRRHRGSFAFYDGPARRVNWPSSWADDADGVWVTGGHPLDSHDHFDRGHVNYISHGKPVLIEAGTPGYDNPAIHTRYSTVVGHNVLEVEGLKPRKAPAPLTVSRLDAGGGDLTVDGTACYPGLKHWRRRVNWNRSQLTVEDQMAAPADKPVVMLFRWHLGTDHRSKSPARVATGRSRGRMARWH